MNIDYIHEPTDLQCGQAVLAMLLGTTAEYICEYLGNSRETDLREMKRVLTDHGINFSPERKQAQTVFDLPRCALLSLETPRCWHWSLYADGVFYDPEHGILGDFPPRTRASSFRRRTSKPSRKPLRTNPTGRRRSSREPPRSTPARTAARESSATA